MVEGDRVQHDNGAKGTLGKRYPGTIEPAWYVKWDHNPYSGDGAAFEKRLHLIDDAADYESDF